MIENLASLREGVLGEIANVLMGQSPVGSSYNRVRIGAPLINGPTEFTDRYPIPKQWTTAPVRFCEANDVLICVRGSSTGRMNIADQNYCIGRGVAAIRAKRGNDQTFVTYALSAVVSDLLSLQTGSTFPSIDSRVIKGGRVQIPSLREQERIGEALLGADDLIATLERLIAKKQAIKQGMMQQLLTGRTRLPGFTNLWSEATIYELANNHRILFNDGDWVEAEHVTNIGNRLLQTGNIGVGRLLDRGIKRYVSDDSFSSLKCKEVVPGDILICRLAEPAGRSCIVIDIGERRMLTSVDVSIYRPDPALADRRFLVAVFSTPGWFQEVSERCGGSTRTRIARSELGRIRISLPSLEEQKRIADVLDDANNELDALDARLAKARVIKQGMMQQLLTGRIRLPVEASR